MGKIIILIGKSSSGKDTIYNKIKSDSTLNLKPIVLYTTRPIRAGETDKETYHFVDNAKHDELKDEGVIIEDRVYHTVHGDWRYFTVDDGSIDLSQGSYIAIATIEAYCEYVKYFGSDNIVPIYIEVDDGTRLQRALARELRQENGKFKEMCRRFLADCEDFSEEKITQAGIKSENRFENNDFDKCVEDIRQFILRSI